MSRGPSPAFSNPMAYPASSSSTIPTSSLPPVVPARSNLRVNTEGIGLRLRSNSAWSSSRSMTSPVDSSGHHQSSRSFSNGASGLSSASLDTSEQEGDKAERVIEQIKGAAKESGDGGDTLDLSRLGVEVLSFEAVEVLRKGIGKDKQGVWRLALAHSYIRDGAIASNFSQLSRLRYLNLKGNLFTEVPKPLTELAGLEILDLSKNRITAFPETPGTLVNLKVLSMTHNMMYTLPAYMTEFKVLKVFKVDHNPIEWPPKEVLGPLIETEQATEPRSTLDTASNVSRRSIREEDLRPWIENMKSWIRQRALETDRLLSRKRTEDEAYLATEEEPLSASSAVSMQSSTSTTPWNRSETSLNSSASDLVMSAQQTIRPQKDDARSSALDTGRPKLGPRKRSATMSETSAQRPTSPFSASASASASSSHRRGDSSSSGYTPPASAKSNSSAHSGDVSTNLPRPPPVPLATIHNRGASETPAQRYGTNLSVKKSLPDLRQSHAQIIQARRHDHQSAQQSRPLGLGIKAPGGGRFQPGAPGMWSSPEMIKSPSSGPTMSDDTRRSLARQRSAELLGRLKGAGPVDSGERRNSQEGPLVDDSRNSYFRRLSTLPVSTISKAIPSALLKLVDAIRGILFALSQLHTALRQYLVFAVTERVAGIFSRVMEPASAYMTTLINTLDRFDSMSRRHTPPVHAIRAVIDATKESVAVFGKVIAVLRLQMPALKDNDVRYTRTLLLMIYGSMAEVAGSWKEMVPLLVEIKPLLAADGAGMAARAIMGGQKMVPTGSLTGRTPISPIPERGESHSPPSVSRPSVSTIGNSPLNEVAEASPAPASAVLLRGRARRQGGSFSSQDVERGMLMGSPVGSGKVEESTMSYTRHRPSESAQIVLEEQEEESEAEEETLAPMPSFKSKHANHSSTSLPPVTPPEPIDKSQTFAIVSSNSQPGYPRGHKAMSSTGSHHGMVMASTLPGPVRKLSVDIRPPTPTSATLFDDDLLDVIETATDIAFTVWLRLAEDVGASTPPFSGGHAKTSSQGSMLSQPDSARLPVPFANARRPSTISASNHIELLNLLSEAEQITSNLREALMGLRANPYNYATTTLPDNAQAFIKVVVKVSGLVKVISATHNFPAGVRQSCSKLTQATRECAILMQVSSLRPANVTPAPIPPVSARPASPTHFSRSSQAGASNSAEDLHISQSVGYAPNSATSWSQSSREGGLRGLQLPSRQMALSKSRNGTGSNGVRSGSQGGGIEGFYGLPGASRGGPRSAQANQLSFQ